MNHTVRWTTLRLQQRLELLTPLVYRRSLPLPPFRFLEMDGPQANPPVSAEIDDAAWPVVRSNSYWANWLCDFTLRTSFAVPGEWESDSPVALHLPLGKIGDFSHPEALVHIDGMPIAGCDRHHQEVLLQPRWCDGSQHLLALPGWTGRGGWQGAEPGSRPLMGDCRLVQIDTTLREFIVTARVALGVVNAADDSDPVRGRLLNALDASFNLLNLQEPLGSDFYDSAATAHQVLRDGINGAGQAMAVDLVAAGHAHIDVAWLWTLAQTRQKAARTFHTVLHLMEQFPAYHFTQSQPQLYDYILEDHPVLFAEIAKRVAAGRWEAIGGMWVEADCNLSGAESLARQFLLGRTFFRTHFGTGAESPVLWLPDVFGYAWALPQLIKQAGLEFFFTIKIGWNQYNRMPYDSFWWQGIDGTRVLTHYSTTPGDSYASTYNAMAAPEAIIGTWQNFQQKDQQHTLLMAYGYGDGGGGPTREMLENLQAMPAFPAAPQVQTGKVVDFFRAMKAEAGEALPTWNGELYLEYHRGTYTTQSRNKRANRKAEFLLHDAEFLASYASALSQEQGREGDNYVYPQEDIDRAWKLVCLNQFHDIIPGSSISEVYVDSLAQYAEVGTIGTAVKSTALAQIGRHFDADLLLANPTSFTLDTLVQWSGTLAAGQAVFLAETELPAQITASGTLIDAGGIAPYSITPLTLGIAAAPQPGTALSISTSHLENQFLRVEVNEAGDITSIYDKTARRELLPASAIANQLQAFEDRPLNFDAWDIDIFYDDKVYLADPAASITVIETGPLRAALQIERRILNSTIVQTISLSYNQPQLDFDTAVDWRERQTLLKAAFPVEILAPAATFEIQWGSVQRPTHRNTSWDWARFESCAQKWVDLSEGDYGVSLLNDCKYGHDVHDKIMRISLLRSPSFPDPQADYGLHRFAYSLRPHAGSGLETTIKAAYALNDPPLVHEVARSAGSSGSELAGPISLIRSSHAHVVIETIKRAQDGRGLIVRLFESQRRRGAVTLTSAVPMNRVWRTNLLEEDQEEIAHMKNQIRLEIKPFEIVTLRLE